jgi:hypothetical protein
MGQKLVSHCGPLGGSDFGLLQSKFQLAAVRDAISVPDPSLVRRQLPLLSTGPCQGWCLPKEACHLGSSV